MGQLLRIKCERCRLSKRVGYGCGFAVCTDLHYCQDCRALQTQTLDHNLTFPQIEVAHRCPRDATHTTREVLIPDQDEYLICGVSCPRCGHELRIEVHGLWD
jgi:hypothetical protein